MRGWGRIPFIARVPLLAAALMVVVGVIASQQVLAALNRLQDERIREVARLHVEALSVALGPHVLRNDVWEVYDTLTRATGQGEGRRIRFTAVADVEGRILAATDPLRAPIGGALSDFATDAVAPAALTILPESPTLKLVAPLVYQDRVVGRMVTELDVADLLAERRAAGRALVIGNAVATLLLAVFGFAVTWRMLRPVGLLASHISGGGKAPRPFEEREIPAGDTEISRLFRSFNRMVAAIEEKTIAERRLAERERFVSLGRLASSLAHEINNPLGGLMNAADTISRYADRPEVVRRSASLLSRGLAHMAEVARATLEMNRLKRDDSPLTRQDIDDLKLLIDPELKSRGQTLDWQVELDDADPPGLPAAPVRQVVLNLLLNAAAVAGRGGRVGLAVDATGERLDIAVRDTGPGLDDHARRRLLSDEPVPPGGGMGLRLVREIVTGLGGTVAVGREDGQTEVRIALPLGHAALTRREAENA
ncbi:MAG: HAMP domain-containing protein [Alphaproteobacteria bacterium]|nr:MAG: HAMP domain-containing protein [Alphaproteobacteria bacterium]